MRTLVAPTVVLCLCSAASHAQFRAKDWELALAGTGTTLTGGDSSGEFALGVRVAVGYFLTDSIELSLRQQIAYSDIGAAGAFRGQTMLAADWNFALGRRWEPYVGVQGAYQYGDVVADSLSAGPEAGVRYFLNDTTFIYLSVEYDFFFRTGRSGSTSDDDQFLYTVGVGVKL